MNCPTCLQNCDPLVTDKCTKYTGPNIDELGICKGMSLFEVEAIIFNKLQTIATPTEIKLEELSTTCNFITELLETEEDQPFSLQQFGEVVFKAICQLDSKITVIEDSNPPASFNVACLTGTLTTRDQILQALITKVCQEADKVEELQTDYVKSSDLCSLVQQCNIATPPPSVSSDYYTRMVPYAPIPYIGSLSNFDNTGKGLVAAGFDKVYLMNGLNGTQDWRGFSPIGAIQNVPGGTLDSRVDPSLAPNVAYNYVAGQKYGQTSVTLLANQIPSHSHTVTDPGHTHTVPTGGDNQADNNTNNYLHGQNPDGRTNTLTTTKSYTGITLGSAGGGQAHTNLGPVVGTLYIVYIP